MTRLEELQASQAHLHEAARQLHRGVTCAVLSRARRAKLEDLERRVYEAIADIDEELDRRVVAEVPA